MRSWVRVAAAVTLLSASQMPASAQQPTFRSATELVSLNVSVIGPNAKPVSGLAADQFQVFEDGVQQDVQFFSPGELPLDVVILLDTSASMTGSIGLVQHAASRFAHSLRGGDRAAVMGISNGLRVLQTFTNDTDMVDLAIKSTRPAGKTPLYASIYTALNELAKQRRSAPDAARRQAIVVLSDGQDTSSMFTFDELLTEVRRSAVPIYAIAPRPSNLTKAMRATFYGQSTSLADFELKKLAMETGGRSFFPVSLVEISGIYDDIASELASQYSIGYQSSNRARTGTFRRIALKILAPGLTWRTRAGYVAGRASASQGGDDDR
jgi:Ca-activated chloride channel family protein